MTTDRVSTWVEALLARHTGDLTRPELLKAIRALSARYVERRAELPGRSPIDSAGKRAAFAVRYAPLHFVTADLVIRALGEPSRPRRQILDLGCGTGVASAAWALAGSSSGRPAVITGVDRDRWALDEARWNWRVLGLKGRATPGDLVSTLERSARGHTPARGAGLIMGWSANELDTPSRGHVKNALVALGAAGTVVIVIEPIARRAAPWWHDWAATFTEAGGRADEWSFDAALPAALARLDADAGFDRRALKARSLRIGPV